MGSRHNRKRTRSRPRNRPSKSHSHSSSLSSASPLTYDTLSVSSNPLSVVPPLPQQPPNIALPRFGAPYSSQGAQTQAAHWHQMYSAWQARAQIQQQLAKQRKEMEERRLRVVFGGLEGEGTSLCPEMVGVVKGLFGGEMDYEDESLV